MDVKIGSKSLKGVSILLLLMSTEKNRVLFVEIHKGKSFSNKIPNLEFWIKEGQI
ncbi:hypothetical protein [Algoriphagus antarcticus]|uniref:hypothetical protein n=1 Tax=Algoriphagus antarcticus TaxID=238540 RepID=UPI00146A111C|nr:hypothetical protein [Algoriphagus antarcticus]